MLDSFGDLALAVKLRVNKITTIAEGRRSCGVQAHGDCHYRESRVQEIEVGGAVKWSEIE